MFKLLFDRFRPAPAAPQGANFLVDDSMLEVTQRIIRQNRIKRMERNERRQKETTLQAKAIKAIAAHSKS